jgi:hypothetical protein
MRARLRVCCADPQCCWARTRQPARARCVGWRCSGLRRYDQSKIPPVCPLEAYRFGLSPRRGKRCTHTRARAAQPPPLRRSRHAAHPMCSRRLARKQVPMKELMEGRYVEEWVRHKAGQDYGANLPARLPVPRPTVASQSRMRTATATLKPASPVRARGRASTGCCVRQHTPCVCCAAAAEHAEGSLCSPLSPAC